MGMDAALDEYRELYRLHQAERMIAFARRHLNREPTLEDLEQMAANGDFAPIKGPDGQIDP
jgi:hypothetical protein